ncbi:MAG: hypothetical protein E7435_04950 [Ruminococcaceae bacterium]|nr:hypothetical protein [Oscillospiraceae bacterium]
MDEYGCDYSCRTVGEEIYERPRMLTLRLRIIENEDEEFASCAVFPEEKRITFKIDRLLDLIKVMEL